MQQPLVFANSIAGRSALARAGGGRWKPSQHFSQHGADALSEGAAADAEWRWPLGLWETEETPRVLSGKACACMHW